MFRKHRMKFYLASLTLCLFVLLSVIGFVVAKPGEPLFLISPCYKGVKPSFSIGGSREFGYHLISFGPKYFQVRMRVVSWPGGVAGLTLVNRNLCPGISQEVMDKDTEKDMIKRPELYQDEG
jgi:hypothetical protein